MSQSGASRLGYRASVALFIETVPFFLAQVAGLFGVNTLMLSFLASALFPASFITMIAALHTVVPPAKRLYTRIALAFASVYAAFCTAVYFLQLGVVRTNPLGLSADVIRLIDFTPGNAAFAIDMLGYGFMCLAALALIPTVTGTGARDRWLRGLLFAKALMAIPTIAFPALVKPTAPGAVTPMVNAGALGLIGWCLVFMPIAVLFAGRFRALDE
jgi:hypothetical protein